MAVIEHTPDHLSEEEAARLWQRAAQLQAEAARRAEAAANEGQHAGGHDLVPTEGYDLAHVRAAAVEAGIGEEFLDAAWSDLRAERAIPPSKRSSGLVRRLLADPPDTLSVRRTVSASPQRVLEAMEQVFNEDPYRLSLVDREGDPLDGGLLIFNIDGASFVPVQGSTFHNQVSTADLRQVIVSIRPLPGDAASCELTLRSPVAWAHRINLGIGGVFTALTSGVGLAGGSAVGGWAAAALVGSGIGLAAAVATTLTVGATVAGAALGANGFRALYGWGLGKGTQALEGIASSIAVRAQGGWGLVENAKSNEAGGPRSLAAVEDVE